MTTAAKELESGATGDPRTSRATNGDPIGSIITPLWVRTRFRTKPLRAADSSTFHAACPVCESQPFEPIVALATRRGERIVQRALCVTCGHVAFSRLPSEDWFAALYRHEFETVSAPPSSPPPKQSIAILDVLAPRMKAGRARILDIGCGYGSALQNFRALGHTELFGLEPSDRRAQVARGDGFQVAHGTAEAMLEHAVIQQNLPFDVIYSWHAFEHIFDVRRAMANAAAALRPGGLLFVCVPHQEAEHFVQMAHYLPHIHSFSNESLRALMESQGLQVIYEDTSLRMIARKPDGSRLEPAGRSPVDHRERSRLKFIRDFGLRRPPSLSGNVCLQYSDYRGSREVLEPSFGKFRRLDEDLSTKLASHLLASFSDTRHTDESLRYRLGTKWLGMTTRRAGPLVVGRARVDLPPRGALPMLEFVYGDDDVVAWYK